jgi:hypothetical protein
MRRPTGEDYRKMLNDPRESMIIGNVAPIPSERADKYFRLPAPRDVVNNSPSNYRKRTLKAGKD